MHSRDFSLRLIHDHPVVVMGQRRAIIDTGSPWSMEAPGVVTRSLGTDVAWLVGNDRLKRHRVLFDWENGILRVGGPLIRGEEIDLTETMGVYQVPLDTPIGRTRAVLDTGAQLSYAPSRAVVGQTRCGTAKDFYPLLGEFDVDLYEVPIRFAGRSYNVKMGVLPAVLESLMSATGAEWILGTDVLQKRSVQLDLANKRMIAHSPRPARGGGGMPLLLQILADRENQRLHHEPRVVSSPVSGWRGWRLFRDESGEPRLRSLTRDTEWDGPVQVADRDPRTRGDRSGIHCYATPGGLSRLANAVVYGEITLFGTVCVHETGYRGERARIDRLYLRSCGLPPGDDPRNEYCGCRELEPGQWLTLDDLETIARSLSHTYQCEVILDRDRPRMGRCRVHYETAQARRQVNVTDRQAPRGDSSRGARDLFSAPAPRGS